MFTQSCAVLQTTANMTCCKSNLLQEPQTQIMAVKCLLCTHQCLFVAQQHFHVLVMHLLP